MKANPSMHERLAERLASILTKLNMGQRLSIKELAMEFSVSTRTVSRDFDRMSSYLPILQDECSKKFYLDPAYLSKIKPQDIQNFAQLSGVSELYPSLDISFLRELLDHRADQVYSAKGYVYEDAGQYAVLFKDLGTAIQQSCQISFLYKNEPRTAQPYRLIHHHGSWYLAASREGQLRSYKLSHMCQTHGIQLGDAFELDDAVLSALEDEDSIWLGQEKFEVEVMASAEVASYFKQRRLLPEQEIKSELEDGRLLLTSQIGHSMQLLPLVRFWMPGLSIVKPESLKQELKDGMTQYLQAV